MSPTKHRFTWQAYDGYVGGSRPQYAFVDEQDILECDSVEEAVRIVEESIQEAFERKIEPSYDLDKITAQVAAIFANKEEEE